MLNIGGDDVVLGKGLANQVGNVTECAMLGLLLKLGVLCAVIN